MGRGVVLTDQMSGETTEYQQLFYKHSVLAMMLEDHAATFLKSLGAYFLSHSFNFKEGKEMRETSVLRAPHERVSE